MKTPLSWISLYTPIQAILKKHSIKELAHMYSIHTAEIDSIDEQYIDKVLVGKVVSCEKHPDSKKLSIVQVDLGSFGKETILTGAANIIDTTYVTVAMVGAVLPGDFTIGERMMAGMMSRGMICSDDELGLSHHEADGIMNLEEHWNRELLETMIGKSFFDLTIPFVGANGESYDVPLRDYTFEIDNKFITNRPDLFSVYGNAREWHAVFDTPFQEYVAHHSISCKQQYPVTIATDKVLSYHAMKMEGVTIHTSPFGIRIMMERAGLTPKLDVVDITNCVMTEFGQPMHVFDAKKIEGGIVVRMAKTGEKLLALNGIEYTLSPLDVVIADERKPIALAGIIGGMETSVTSDTVDILWEAACFDAVTIRLSAQRHGIRTDSSTRFEKSLDPVLAGTVFPRVMDYLLFLKKDAPITHIFSHIHTKAKTNSIIRVSYDFITMKSGVVIPIDTVNAILSRLGFVIDSDGREINVHVPSWRATKDISTKEDIVEEVVRIYGYDKVPLTPIIADIRINKKNPEQCLRNSTLSFWSKRGWNEVYNYSFTSVPLDAKIHFVSNSSETIEIKNAFNTEYTHMRRSLANRLLENIAYNKKYSDALRFFELGNVYKKDDSIIESQSVGNNTPFCETKMFAGCMSGGNMDTLRNDIEAYLSEILGYIPPLHNSKNPLPFLHPGVCGEYRLGDTVLLRFGKIHPTTRDAFELPEDTIYFEVEYETILQLQQDKEILFSPISRYQTLSRELNFVMPEHIETGVVARNIDAIHPWIGNVVVDSIYRDITKIGDSNKSVNFSFTLTNMDGTISDEEALVIQTSIIETMKQSGFNLRQ